MAGVELGEEMAVEATLELDMAEEVLAGDLAVRLWASKEMALLLLLLVLALGPAKRCVVPSRLFMAPKAMMAMRTSSSSASIPRRLE